MAHHWDVEEISARKPRISRNLLYRTGRKPALSHFILGMVVPLDLEVYELFHDDTNWGFYPEIHTKTRDASIFPDHEV